MTTIIHTKIAMYPIPLPGNEHLPNGWLNLANVVDCMIIEINPMVVEVNFIDGSKREYISPQAEAIIDGFKEAHQKYCK